MANPTPPPVVIPVTPPLTPPTVYHNAQQTATANCPLGERGGPSVATVAANTPNYDSTLSQLDANNRAYAGALAQANAALNCGLVGQLSGLLWTLPTSYWWTNTCPPNSIVSTVAVGTPGQLYTVSLRLRGVIESKSYCTHPGEVGLIPIASQSGYALKCGDPSIALPAIPADGSDEYVLTISDPPQMFFLNAWFHDQGWPTSMGVRKVDFNLAVQIRTGATVTLAAYSIDSLEWPNLSPRATNSAPFTLPAAGSTVPVPVASSTNVLPGNMYIDGHVLPVVSVDSPTQVTVRNDSPGSAGVVVPAAQWLQQPLAVPDDAPENPIGVAQPYGGQFLQMDILNIG